MTLAKAIARFEGWDHQESVARRLNNPGNLMFAGQPGATPGKVTGADGKIRNYAKFSTEEQGWAALDRQLKLYAKRGLTLRQMIAKYAPVEDNNNPKGYLHTVATWLEVDPDIELTKLLGSEAGDGGCRA